jgi:hypothetical protein
MKKMLAEYDFGGIKIFIPCNVSDADEFIKDAVPVKLPEPEPIDHDDWYNTQHDFNEINHIPETYKD